MSFGRFLSFVYLSQARLAGVLQGVENQIGDMLIGQSVNDVLPLPAPRYQALVTQDAQPLGNGGDVFAFGF